MNTIGRNRVNSTSKIAKIIAIKKKWRENGSRAEFFGSNPHSNGLIFSRSLKDFFEIVFNNITIIIIISTIVKEINIILRITYSVDNRFFDWKSIIIFILNK